MNRINIHSGRITVSDPSCSKPDVYPENTHHTVNVKKGYYQCSTTPHNDGMYIRLVHVDHDAKQYSGGVVVNTNTGLLSVVDSKNYKEVENIGLSMCSNDCKTKHGNFGSVYSFDAKKRCNMFTSKVDNRVVGIMLLIE